MKQEQKMMKLSKHKGLMAFVVLQLLLLGITPILGQDSDVLQGSFTLDAVPATSGVNYVDSVYALTSTLNPNDLDVFGVNFTIDFPASMDFLDNVTLNIFDDSLHGADYTTNDPNGYDHIRVTWVETTDVWAIDQDTLSQWTEQSSIDPGSSSALTNFEFVFRFDISKIARADTDWNVTVIAYDNSTPVDSGAAAETALVTMNEYYEQTPSSSTFSWGTVDSGSTNVTHGALSIDIIANAQWEIQINSTDFNATGESDVDIEGQNVIVLDEDGSAGGTSQWIRNTIGVVVFTAWDNVAPLTTETAVTLNIYIFLTTSTYFDAGAGKTWSCWVTFWLQANT